MSSANTPALRRTTFRDLPREIRDQVYEYAYAKYYPSLGFEDYVGTPLSIRQDSSGLCAAEAAVSLWAALSYRCALE